MAKPLWAWTCPKVNYSHGMEFRATFWLQSSGRRKEALLAHSDPQGLACKSWGSWCTYHSLPHIYEASTSTMWRLSRQSWPQAFALLNFPLPQISNFMKWMNECLKKKKREFPCSHHQACKPTCDPRIRGYPHSVFFPFQIDSHCSSSSRHCYN